MKSKRSPQVRRAFSPSEGASSPAAPTRSPHSLGRVLLPLRVAAGIIRRDDGRILITQRCPGDSLGGMWEFPGGTLEKGETYAVALKRELEEEIGVIVSVGALYHTVSHPLRHRLLRIRFFEATILSGRIQAIDVAAWKWVRPRQLTDFPFPPADRELILKLQS